MCKIKKTIKKLLTLFSIFILILSFPLKSNAEGSLSVSRWLVKSKLLKNGDLFIEEDITYDFSGDFNGIFREIILDKTNGIENIEVIEMIKGKEISYKKVKNAKKGGSNIYEVYEDSDKKEIKIFSPSQDEQKTFRFRYTVKNVAIKYNDIGELNYKFLGTKNETPIDYFSVNIKLPEDRNDKVKIFAHGPSNGEIVFQDENTVHMEIENIPINTFIEGRILFPTSFISNSSNLIDKNAYEEISNEEKALQEKIKNDIIKKEKGKATLSYTSLILSGIETIFLTILMIKFKRKENIYERVDLNLIPEDCTPAVASYFCNSSIDSNSIVATILDLTRKGYLKIKNEKNDEKKINNIIIEKIKNEDEKLLSHEKYFMNWILSQIGNGNQVETKEIQKYAEDNYIEFYRKHHEWILNIKKDTINKGYYDEKSKKPGIFIAILSSIFLIISIITLIFGGKTGLISLIIFIFGLVYGILLFFRKSDLGYNQLKKWQRFIKYMEEEKDNSEKDIFKYPLDISLIYALALGVDREILNEYKIYTQKSYDVDSTNSWLYWYFLTNHNNENTLDHNIDKAFETTSSSYGGDNFGSGGGFTGGGGGGAGGGGTGGF